MCKLNTSEQSPVVVWERKGDAILPRFVSPRSAMEYHLNEGDEIDAGMRSILRSVDGPLLLTDFETILPANQESPELRPPVAVIDL